MTTQVKWWESDRLTALENRTKRGNIRKKYFEANFDTLLTDWPGDAEIKYLRVTFGTGNRVELQLYHSLHYTTYRKKMKKEMPIIEGKYFLALQDIKFKNSKTASKVVQEMEEIKYKFSKMKLMKEENWLTSEQTIEVLERINQLMTDLDAYDVMDALLGDLADI
jgi:activator of 2-hydroxyglutaryl-CoA dehydratase